MASESDLTWSEGMPMIWNASRWADFGPTPGSFPNSEISFATLGEYLAIVYSFRYGDQNGSFAPPVALVIFSAEISASFLAASL